MKTCAKCGECKPFTEFNKKVGAWDGYRHTCKPCKASALREWRAANHAATQEKARAYYAARMRPWFQRRYVENKTTINDRSKTWRETNPDKHNAKEARRRAAKLQATPGWADSTQIAAVYEEASAMRALGLDVQVDHIVPLQGKNVCGLHVHTNLQLLLADDNRSKSNKRCVSVT